MRYHFFRHKTSNAFIRVHWQFIRVSQAEFYYFERYDKVDKIWVDYPETISSPVPLRILASDLKDKFQQVSVAEFLVSML